MKRFLKQILINLALCTAFFFGIGSMAEKIIDLRLAQNTRVHVQSDWHDLEGHNSDILFIGNSRTWTHIDPLVFESQTHLKAEVLGQDGQSPRILYYKFEEYLKVNEPPIEIFLQFDPYFWGERGTLYGFHTLAPYFYKDRLSIIKKLDGLKGYNELYRKVPLLAFQRTHKSRKIFFQLLFNDSLDHKQSWERNKGFYSKEGERKHRSKAKSIYLNKNHSSYIDSFFALCKSNGIIINGLFTPMTNSYYKNFKNIKILDT